MPWSKKDFLDVLSSAHRAERAWVEKARSQGRAIAHGRKIVLPDHNPKKDFCPTPDCVAAVQIEIKLRGLRFTSPDDYPYSTVFIDDMHGLAHADPPFAWVFVSKPTGKWVWACSLDWDDSWGEQNVYDAMRRYNVPMLVAPKSCLREPDQLLRLFFGSDGLQWVEGETGCFRDETQKQDPRPRGRSREAPKDSD